MPDIRERVEEDRGFLKKLQLHIPGYAGYRRREDIRQADNILRIEIYQRIKNLRTELENVREAAAQSPRVSLSALGNVMFELQGIEARVRHAEQGYSGFVAAIRIEESELDKLYEYDYAMINSLDQAGTDTGPLQAAVSANDKAAFDAATLKIRGDLRAFDDAWKTRVQVITGTAVQQ